MSAAATGDAVLWRRLTRVTGERMIMDMQSSLRRELDIYTRRSKALAEAAWIDASRVIDLIARDGLDVRYVPKIAASNLQCVGFEALARLKGTFGRAGTDSFLGCLERAGIVSPVDVWLCEEVERAIGRWAQREMYPAVSIKLHSDTMACGPAFDEVIKALRYLNVEIELGAGVSLAKDSTLSCVGRLRDSGARVIINDFGVGYTNYQRFAGTHFDSVKLDKDLICGLDCARGRVVLAGACDLCRKLGLKVIAAGIETQNQLEIARTLDIDFFQGLYFGPELSWDEASEYFAMQRVRHTA
ncbi:MULTISPECIES: EAL domain-containing protein [Mycetohabitans]|uniref:EAL domain-containing protein n=2 Tax=Burkholderiaceae TaxID=119060 RepID=UPI000965760F|nr:EAL domain-containing protein [Mycetohabitans sp. B4]MCG1018732.1 EAL domain-containing protein [Mycetohabitans sp. B4]SIT81054.1 EAL domain, c-di-GMP-specific phosphodiesterase class I (or its enzymatically inactive variant) [Burkholderia sp. b13]